MKLLLLFAALLCIKVDADSVTDIPVSFVTTQDIQAGPGDINTFTLRTCGGCLYDNQLVNAYFNLPDKKWDVDQGDFLIVHVYDIHKHVISSNTDPKLKYVDHLNFTYHHSYGDLTFVVQNGFGVAFQYTISVKFSGSKSKESVPSCKPRYISTEKELHRLKLFQENIIGNHWNLVPIFKETGKGSVGTDNHTIYELKYCFNPTEFPGYVLVSLIATDEYSGFASYGCPEHIRPCNAFSPYRDSSGAAINFVRVNITGATTDNGPVQVYIRGDGRYLLKNYFAFSASRFFRYK